MVAVNGKMFFLEGWGKEGSIVSDSFFFFLISDHTLQYSFIKSFLFFFLRNFIIFTGTYSVFNVQMKLSHTQK